MSNDKTEESAPISVKATTVDLVEALNKQVNFIEEYFVNNPKSADCIADALNGEGVLDGTDYVYSIDLPEDLVTLFNEKFPEPEYNINNAVSEFVKRLLEFYFTRTDSNEKIDSNESIEPIA